MDQLPNRRCGDSAYPMPSASQVAMTRRDPFCVDCYQSTNFVILMTLAVSMDMVVCQCKTNCSRFTRVMIVRTMERCVGLQVKSDQNRAD